MFCLEYNQCCSLEGWKFLHSTHLLKYHYMLERCDSVMSQKNDSAFVSLIAWQRRRKSMNPSSEEVWKYDPAHCKGSWMLLWELEQPSIDAVIKGEIIHFWAISIIWLKQNFSLYLLSCVTTHRRTSFYCQLLQWPLIVQFFEYIFFWVKPLDVRN